MSSATRRIIIEEYEDGSFGITVNGKDFMGLTYLDARLLLNGIFAYLD